MALEKIEQIYGSVTLSPGSPSSLYAVVLGRIPSSVLSMYMTVSSDWVGHRLPGHLVAEDAGVVSLSYWDFIPLPFQLHLPQSSVVLVSNGDILDLVGTYLEPSEEGEAFFDSGEEGYEIGFFLPDLQQEAFSGLLNVPGALGLKALRIGSRYEEELYGLSLDFELENEAAGALFQRLARLALVGLLREAKVADMSAKLKPVEIAQKERWVRMEGLSLSAKELARLLGRFLPAAPGQPPTGG
jgi:hypothetical protein